VRKKGLRCFDFAVFGKFLFFACNAVAEFVKDMQSLFENLKRSFAVWPDFGLNKQNGNTVKIRGGRAAVCIRCPLLLRANPKGNRSTVCKDGKGP
jgi:hypothetical protein